MLDFDYLNKPFTIETVERMIENGEAVNGSKGGLALGPSHDEGGIKILIFREGVYRLEAEIEGYEYVMNFAATAHFTDYFEKFNDPVGHEILPFKEYLPSDNIKILDAQMANNKKAKYIILETGGFSIYNKHSTKAYLSTLNEMNLGVDYEKIGENQARFVFKYSEIKIIYNGLFNGIIRLKK